MRLKTKLVVAAAGVTFAIVIVLSALFLAELLRQRIAQTAASDDVLARQVRLMTAQAVQAGLTEAPPIDGSVTALTEAVKHALKDHQPLVDTMEGLVRYSPQVQDVSVSDAQGVVLISTDPALEGAAAPVRESFDRVSAAGVWTKAREVFGQGRVLDVLSPLDRNGKSFLVVRLGVRSSFLRNSYVPYLKDAVLLALLGGVITTLASVVLASVALRPIEGISRRLESLGAGAPARRQDRDAVVRAEESIDRLGQQMRTTEAGYTELQASLGQMLDTLRDGVVLFTAERRAVMVSDAVANFVGTDRPKVGQELWESFSLKTALGAAVRDAFEREAKVVARTLRLEDGRQIEFSLDRIEDRLGKLVGTLLTLRDTGSAQRLEQELEVSRRLAAVGRLTRGVGHEVKNPINAMVVHLELLRGKLEAASPAMRHVDVLAGEMARLDRVVTTLADFTRPMELQLAEMELTDVVDAVVELTSAEMAAHGVRIVAEGQQVRVRADGEALRQALLNLVLNGVQAMPQGGELRISVRREQDCGVVEVQDSGHGIPPDLLPRIFELYFTTKIKGSGIGLAMTYRIAQMHGGAVEVASEPGAGARFTLRLPAVDVRIERAA